VSPARLGWASCITVVLFVTVVAPATGLAAQEDFFVEGNRLYREGDFSGALESYLRIEEAGFESGALYYNIGNSYFKLGELGSAILYYERARRLMPGDDDLQANLELARTLTVDEVNPLPGFLPFRALRWWIHLIPRRALTWLVAVTYVVAMVGLTLWVLWRGSSAGTWAGRMAGAMGVVAAMLGTNLLAIELGIGEARRAVVMDEPADVQSAPTDDPSLQVFTVHEGTTVRIDRQSGDWVEIVLDDGKVGWLEVGALEEI
jgi:tetratricopeptide (TPR) repeat protein